MRDAAHPDELPVLHGVVVPVKDLNFQAGVRCTLGSLAYDMTPFGDDNVVVRMKQGNLVMTGKTNTPEFGLPCYTENAVAPPARTPWDLARSAGGSSGVPRRPSPPASPPLLMAPTVEGRFVSPRACADWWASRPRAGAFPMDRFATLSVNFGERPPSHARCATRPPCST